MFGIICAGRPVQTDLQQVDSNKFVFQIRDAATVNHMVVFLLPGAAAIPPDMVASVYFQLPEKPFRLLGYLSSEKQSAIFKINSNASHSNAYADIDEAMMQDDTLEQFDINVGISIEPLVVVQQTMAEQASASESSSALTTIPTNPTQAAAPATSADIAVLANKIVQHAYTFLGSFVTPDGKVPMKAFDDWWTKFKSKVQANPKFLDNMDI